jgi:GNAT superfamily N-acetyltransferase
MPSATPLTLDSVTADQPAPAIRPATPEDADAIAGLIRELARYERLEHEVTMTADDIRRTLFGEQRFAEALLAEVGDEAVGLALFFSNYSTFLGRPGIYLEDLFVRPEDRSTGLGRALLREVARIAVGRGCGRLEWAVLDWNQTAIDFYEKLGARPNSGWTTYRLTGEALRELGS